MLTTLEFLEALRELSLLEPGQLAAIERRLQEQALRPQAPARKLADKLVEKGWLTSFQVERLLDGRGKELLLGPYVVLDRLGQGGMGTVFTARHRELGRLVAVKVVRDDHLQSAAATDRFKREARAAAQLDHANVVRVYDAGEADGVRYIAMEHVAGTNLADLVKQQGPLPIGLACEHVRQAALGLQHIHERGLVHRDIKPSNLLLQQAGPGETGVVKVLDLGLAGFASAAERDGADRLTESNAVMGTPDFLAPEQAIDAHSVDIRADLYSLGCTLYFLLTGQVPFPGGALPQKLVGHQMHEPEPLERLRPEVPKTLVVVVCKLMAKKPAERYQTPAELVEALARIAKGLPNVPSGKVPQHRPRPAGVEAAATRTFVPRPRAAAGRRWLVPGALALLLALSMLGYLVSVIPRPTQAVVPPTTKPLLPPEIEEELPKTLAIDLGEGAKLEMVLVAAGEFWMGSPDEEVDAVLRQYKTAERKWFETEHPRHKVTITKPFYLGKYKVTQEQYQRVTGKTPSHFSPTGGGKAKVGADTRQFPVDSVSWDDATAFCDDLMKQAGEQLPQGVRQRGYRFALPTEAQWEYACRAGTKTAYHFGDKLNGKQANCDGTCPLGTDEKGPFKERTCKVGEYDSNALGLYDMHGNLWEWCQDYFDEKFYTSGSLHDPINRNNDLDNRRVVRGGSWHLNATGCRAAARGRGGASERTPFVGLRAALRVD